MKTIVLQFNEQDANRLLWLVQREASQGQIYNDYYETLANTIQEQMEAQKGDAFFQCAHCFDRREERESAIGTVIG